jgi:RTX calcium-binding nonapeptide repeat (4 copies)
MLVRDSAGLRVKAGCTTESTTRVSCRRSFDIEIGVARGDDRVALRIGRGTGVIAARIDGGGGDDIIVDGREPALLFGGLGADRIHGGGGMDDVQGDEGRDFLFGGAGPDALFARDHAGDRVLDCGSGRRESALLDRGLDPQPRSC